MIRLYLIDMSKHDKEVRNVVRRTSRYYTIIGGYIFIRPHGKYKQARRLIAEYEVLKVLRQEHDHCLAGHQGVSRTFQAVSQQCCRTVTDRS